LKKESLILSSLRCLKKEPLPKDMTSRELVARAIEFRHPPRVPYYFLYHPNAADMVFVGPLHKARNRPTNGAVGARYTDDWDVTWEVTGRSWDHAIGYPLANLDHLSGYRFPDVLKPIRGLGFLSRLGNLAGKYIIAPNPINLYERVHTLMGFEETMMAPYSQPGGLHRLLDHLTEMTIAAIRTYQGVGGFHGFEAAEDWGLQNRLHMKIETFREFYKPYYKRIIDACHDSGMHYFWHCCGYIVDLLPEMVDLGVDVVQLDQPRLMGHEKLIELVGGRMCMWNTVDIQWCTQENISDEDIRHEIKEMLRVYDVQKHAGGFIAKHYPSPWDINLSPERQRLIYDAFLESGYFTI
jgi:uroporphyrinogen decarboxylase